MLRYSHRGRDVGLPGRTQEEHGPETGEQEESAVAKKGTNHQETEGKLREGEPEKGQAKEPDKIPERDSLERKKRNLTRWTKYLLDVMFYGGIVVTATLPVSVKLIARYLPWMTDHLTEHYGEVVMIYFVLGVAAVVLIQELRKIFRTVLDENCFVPENVASLKKMGNWSFFIAGMSVVRTIVYATAAMMVIIFVFIIAGLFSKVLALVFEEAVRYKEENDLTI